MNHLENGRLEVLLANDKDKVEDLQMGVRSGK